ncbi:DUF397 domain-containing protein [Actinomadura sp. KC345]|uniref:DUF397 domain-containing protein n=1 Tax=Actinomadura sp. KC345 TaxID=2530371 RepID=UPI00104F1D38|nr:DUF397 domain-containing protein [Actinomadura sp. KC345]TDC43366.1 DUF397 domain-containing protein [Actinomadura sp. KC345]
MKSKDIEFRKARRSGMEDGCVEVGRDGGTVRVRDSKARDAGTLGFPVAEFRRFLARLQDR